jgi:polyisoprenoid-binding protein YceI
MNDLKVKTIFNPIELHRSVSSLNGKDREWVESLESACLRLIDLEGYDHASFRIDKTRITSSENVSVNIHIHLMKTKE